jgi:hypothetical protein
MVVIAPQVAAAGISALGGLAGSLFGASDQANALKFQNAMANASHRKKHRKKQYRSRRV